MTINTSGAFAVVEQLYQNYGSRANEISKQGRKVIGYLCALTPVEIIHAAGFVPLRIRGSVTEPITKADAQMETIVCPLVRSCYDMAVKGKYDYVSGLVLPHACDSICCTYSIWANTLELPYTHLINMPHSTDDSSVDFFKEILKTFNQSFSKFAGKEVTAGALKQSIKAYNENRAKVRELLELRKTEPPLITGTEVTKVLVANMSLPVEEATPLLTRVIAEVKQRKAAPAAKGKRIMVVGAQVDDAAFINVVEELGASVVIDDLCPGTREYWEDVDTTMEPVAALADRYLKKVKCGRTYRQPVGNYKDDLEDRFGQIGRFIKDFKVDGIILYIYKYCDSFGFEIPAMKSYIQSLNKPVLYLEDEYSMSSIARLKTRIQAFLEMMS